jgi:hypothetical protein
MKIEPRHLRFLNRAIVLILLALPYYLFSGKLYIGGDDTRLFYAFPELWLENLGWFSWFNLSGLGQHNPQQFIVPLLAAMVPLRKVLPQLVVFNLAFSLPLVLGFVFYQKMLLALLEEKAESVAARSAGILGGVFFVLSPILWAITITSFLYSVWLIALAPILTFCFVKYLQTSRWKYGLGAAVACILLSLSIFSVPWLLGIMLPVLGGLILCAGFYHLRQIFVFLKASVIFTVVIGLTQLFWLLPFFMSLIEDSGSFVGVAMSAQTQDTFRATVMGTMSRNNLFFPIINLFHRTIAFDFDWPLKSAFEQSYDSLTFLNLIFVVVIVLALALHRRVLSRIVRNSFYVFIGAWLIGVFLFTVNIGVLRDLFLLGGLLPGFGMFRNAFDKFAIGYVFVFATLLGFALYIVLKSSWGRWARYQTLAVAICVLAIFLESLPVKTVVDRRLWTTKKISTLIKIPDEYLSFMQEVQSKARLTSNILSLPFALPAYTIIKSENSNSVFAGSSPVKIFTGLNDFSGFMSFSNPVATALQHAVQTQSLSETKTMLRDYSIGYIFITKNIPSEVMSSYLFKGFEDQELLNRKMDLWFLPHFRGERLVVSENGNYEFWKTIEPAAILESENLTFKRLSPVKYKLLLSQVTEDQQLAFNDSFSAGWALYKDEISAFGNCDQPYEESSLKVKECARETHFFDFEDLSYFFKRPLNLPHHRGDNKMSNIWLLNRDLVPVDKSSVALTLYFRPQLYFYLGSAVSMLVLMVLSLLVYRERKRGAL